MPNQDSYEMEILPERRGKIPETVIISVADGAGSARYSKIGSKTVATVAVETLKNRLKFNPAIARYKEIASKELLYAANRAVRALRSEASDREVSPKDLATTLQIVLANESLVAAIHVGDGRTVVMEDDKLENLSKPFNGEYANETVFVTTNDGDLENIRGLDQPDQQERDGERISGVAVSTDGLDPLAVTLATDEPFEGFYKSAFQIPWQIEDNEPTALSIALGKIETRQKSPDDITVVVASKWN